MKKICFSTIGCPEWHWGDILAMASDLDYQGVEVRGVRNELYAPHFKYFQPDRLQETRDRLKQMNLSIPCLTTGCELQKPELKDQNAREMREYIELAKELGTPYIRVLGDGEVAPGGDVDIELIRGLLVEAGTYAAQMGVTLLVETNGYFCDSTKLKALLDSVGLASVQALWDVHHPYRYAGESVQQTIQILGEYIGHVHLKDSLMENGKVRYRMLGQGDIPAKEAVGALVAAGYDGFYCLEWVRRWDMSLEEPGIAFAQYASAMR